MGASGSKKKVLVTGGLGFIGSNLVDVLLEAGHKVVVFDNESTGHNHNSHANCETIIGDITVPADIAKIPTDCDHMIHLAAAISVAESMTNPEKYQKINVDGSRNMLEWAVKNKLKSVVSASSAAVYGDQEKLPISEDAEKHCISPYADTKWAMEAIHKELAASSGIPMICMRFFNVYGPRQDPRSPYSGVISKFFDMARTNQPITIFGDGTATRDFVFVKDIAAALILAMTKGQGHAAYNVGTESITTIKELADLVKGIAKADCPIKLQDPRPGDILHSRSSTAAIRKDLGFKPSKSLSDGMAITYQWFLDDKKANEKN